MPQKRQKSYVYIDGFNLYYGALKGTPHKWLNPSKLCDLLLPDHEVIQIKYFTALVKPLPNDPGQPSRQQAYLRALKTLPNCVIILGHFLSHKVRMPLVRPSHIRKFAEVIKTEEKGSDVNLATHLICDAYEDAFEVAVVISNDSDLAEPIRVVGEKLGKTVGILNPHRHPSHELLKHALFFKSIRKGVLKASQFPDTIKDEKGIIHKPKHW